MGWKGSSPYRVCQESSFGGSGSSVSSFGEPANLRGSGVVGEQKTQAEAICLWYSCTLTSVVAEEESKGSIGQR
jgi:hypothetical protein